MFNINKKFSEKYKKWISIAILFIFLIVAITFIKLFDTKEKEEFSISNFTSEELEETDDEMIIIHITGEVKNEGIIKIKVGGRISDAIEAAGGLTEEADINRVNLAYELEDGQKIYIPNKNDEDVEDYIEDGVDDIVLDSSDATSSTGLININKATVEELTVLNGIGESIAAKIVAYREENGRFTSIEEIKNVSGIGDSKYENIKDSIKVK